jgi:hypothetical protein
MKLSASPQHITALTGDLKEKDPGLFAHTHPGWCFCHTEMEGEKGEGRDLGVSQGLKSPCFY